MDVRLDKWLQVARVFKSRSEATRACNLSRVRVNGEIAKAHRKVLVGDRVEVAREDREKILVVKELRDKTVPKAEAALLFEDLSPPPPPRDSLERLLSRAPVQRERGTGRPTKKDRRSIEEFEDWAG